MLEGWQISGGAARVTEPDPVNLGPERRPGHAGLVTGSRLISPRCASTSTIPRSGSWEAVRLPDSARVQDRGRLPRCSQASVEELTKFDGKHSCKPLGLAASQRTWNEAGPRWQDARPPGGFPASRRCRAPGAWTTSTSIRAGASDLPLTCARCRRTPPYPRVPNIWPTCFATPELRGAHGSGGVGASGIPDFRTPGSGLWRTSTRWRLRAHRRLRRDPDRLSGALGDRFASLCGKHPNEAHLALAELERRGLVRAVITQNIDRLHRLAGSRRLVGCTGRSSWSVCLESGGKLAIDQVIGLLGSGRRVPDLRPRRSSRTSCCSASCCRSGGWRGSGAGLRSDLMLCVGSRSRSILARPSCDHTGGGGRWRSYPRADPYDRRRRGQARGHVVEELRAVLAAL